MHVTLDFTLVPIGVGVSLFSYVAACPPGTVCQLPLNVFR